MNSFVAEARDTLFPRRDAKDGPLPPLLVAMTLVTGLTDAFSFLVLGQVFVANMTGNVVFIAFGLAGVPHFSIAASLVALGSFLVGTLSGGRLGSRLGKNRGRFLSSAASIEALFIGTSAGLVTLSWSSMTTDYLYTLVVLLGISMGVQNATARRLGVPDLTTTVLTMTIVGIGADSHLAGGTGSRAGRRTISVAAMFLGAISGALLILRVAIVYPLLIALIVIAVIAVSAWALSRGNPAWASA